MKKPDFITFTGIDAKTDFDHVDHISKQYPCEWGVLFSRNRQGIENRYPDLNVINSFLTIPNILRAAHICGKHAQDIMAGKFDTDIPLERFNRFQINHTDPNEATLVAFARHHNISPDAIIAQTQETYPDKLISWLYDPSGGRGRSPSVDWPINNSAKRVGYAGGINPNNAAAVNAMVDSPAGYWLDMETGVRTDDWLDLTKVENVLKAIYL